MAIAILDRFRWELAKGNVEEYKKFGGRFVEGTNEEVENTPKFLAIFDEIVKKVKKEIKLRKIAKQIKKIKEQTKKIKKEIAKKKKK